MTTNTTLPFVQIGIPGVMVLTIPRGTPVYGQNGEDDAFGKDVVCAVLVNTTRPPTLVARVAEKQPAGGYRAVGTRFVLPFCDKVRGAFAEAIVPAEW